MSELKRIENLDNKAKKILLDFVGFENTRQAQRTLKFNTSKELYNKLKREYNKFVKNDITRRAKERFEELKLQEERKRQKAIEKRKITNRIKRLNVGSSLDIDLSLYTKKDYERLFNNLKNNKYLIKFNNRIYTLNNANMKNLIEYLSDPTIINDMSESDANLILEIVQRKKFTLERLPTINTLIEGAFFKHTHKTNLDLTPLQIFNEVKAENYIDNCFVYALKIYAIENDNLLLNQIDNIKRDIKTRDLPISKIQEIANKYNLHISVKRNEDTTNIRHFGDKQLQEIKLGLIDNHYFIIKEIEVNSFALKNYELVKDEEYWYKINKIKNGKYFSKEKKYINSFQVIKILLENKETLLTEITKCDEIYKTPYHEVIDKIHTLEYNDSQVKENEYEEKVNRFNYTNFFIDFETITSEEKHIPYLCCCATINEKFYGENCGRDMLNYIIKDRYKTEIKCNKKIKDNKKKKFIGIRLIAHNAGYDLRFLFNHLIRPSFIERGNMLLRGNGIFDYFGEKVNIQIQDSYALIPMPLRNFGKTFNINMEKEIIPYDLYTKENVNKVNVSLNECVKFCEYEFSKRNIGTNINEDDEKDFVNKFIENSKKWNCFNEEQQTINIIEYSNYYCKIDCDVLRNGYNTFKDWIDEVCKLSINDYVSLPSLANAYMTKNGVYDDVYMLSGNVREFIQLCMVGGRTMISNNEKKVVNYDVDDFDAVSLYPSAMERLQGYLIGKPKVIDNLNYDWLKDQDGYFVEILIKEVNKNYSFPLMSYKNKDGIRDFNNNMVGKIIHVDKLQLEDLINFQEIKFDIIRGYYYNEGRNEKLKEVISYLFNERLRQKKLKNPIEAVYKLLMNSAYGKTLLKPIDDKVDYVPISNFEKHVVKYYNHIKEITPLERCYRVKQFKAINEHFNNVACGVEVLSMSKRIMNEVMCLAEDNKINIYYQDTDSMHIDSDKVNILSDLYKVKYDKELIGKNMCQFHVDFSSDIIKGDIKSVKSIYLGKKCYCDKLEGKDENGNIVNDYHIRMKGVSNQSIQHLAYEKYNGDIMKIYEELYEGKELEFDLLCGGKKVSFEFHKDMTISSRQLFKRKIKF